MIEKVKQLEKVSHAMTRKVLSLEEEIVQVKHNSAKYEVVKEFRNLTVVRKKAVN